MAVSIFMSVSKKEVPWCPIDATLAVIDGRWKGTIVWCLLAKPMRPCELQRVIPQITERMLLRHLRDLVTDGIVLRLDEGKKPPRVQYSVSPYGRTLQPLLESMVKWGLGHIHARKQCSSEDF